MEASAELLEVALHMAYPDRAPDANGETIQVAMRKAAAIVRNLAERDYGALVVEILQLEAPSRWSTKPGVARLVSFAVELARAQDSASMASAFEHFAAPLGSSVAKRERRGLRAGINAYVGGFGGREWSTVPGTDQRTSATSMGAWVPVGFEVGTSWGGHGLGLFVHVIDVGALASYRIAERDAPVESTPSINFKRIFSPGAFLTWGWKGAPLTVAAGVSYAPELREIKALSSATEMVHTGALRFGLTLALDIPLFP